VTDARRRAEDLWRLDLARKSVDRDGFFARVRDSLASHGLDVLRNEEILRDEDGRYVRMVVRLPTGAYRSVAPRLDGETLDDAQSAGVVRRVLTDLSERGLLAV
jgi:hypothetical protein